ncbi:hypothetical protein T484DRAFT_1754521 [Baffinella frigidus]|nr:hypothetical protein T484DRAFT_1754521 [Cryptophyta sp. CCMP2293]
MFVTPDHPDIEAYGQGDPALMRQVQKDHDVDRQLLEAVKLEKIRMVEELVMQGANAARRFVIGREKVDYSDLSRSQNRLRETFYSHSPLMVAVLNQSIDIMDLLLESQPLDMQQVVHLFRYAIEQHKNLALALLLRRNGYLHVKDPAYDLIRYARSLRETDAEFIMDNERDHPGWCATNWCLIERVVRGNGPLGIKQTCETAVR